MAIGIGGSGHRILVPYNSEIAEVLLKDSKTCRRHTHWDERSTYTIDSSISVTIELIDSSVIKPEHQPEEST